MIAATRNQSEGAAAKNKCFVRTDKKGNTTYEEKRLLIMEQFPCVHRQILPFCFLEYYDLFLLFSRWLISGRK